MNDEGCCVVGRRAGGDVRVFVRRSRGGGGAARGGGGGRASGVGSRWPCLPPRRLFACTDGGAARCCLLPAGGAVAVPSCVRACGCRCRPALSGGLARGHTACGHTSRPQPPSAAEGAHTPRHGPYHPSIERAGVRGQPPHAARGPPPHPSDLPWMPAPACRDCFALAGCRLSALDAKGGDGAGQRGLLPAGSYTPHAARSVRRAPCAPRLRGPRVERANGKPLRAKGAQPGGVVAGVVPGHSEPCGATPSRARPHRARPHLAVPGHTVPGHSEPCGARAPATGPLPQTAPTPSPTPYRPSPPPRLPATEAPPPRRGSGGASESHTARHSAARAGAAGERLVRR